MYVPFAVIVGASFPEAFSKRVMVDLQLCDLKEKEDGFLQNSWIFHFFMSFFLFVFFYLWVLVSSDGSENGFWEGESLERAPADRMGAVHLDDMESWVVAMHGVKDDLLKTV